jgi:hypothetical protein
MRPSVDRVLQQLAGNLVTEVAPAISVDYVQRNTGLVSGLLMCAAEEWDRAAERRLEENRELRRIFAEAVIHVADTGLRGRLEEAARAEETSLRIQELDRSNDALRALLIELHAHVEDLKGPASQHLEAEIWKELLRSTERRALSLSPF